MVIKPNSEGREGSVSVGNDEREVVHSFCYLGDVTYIRCAWQNFHELLPVSCEARLSFKHRGGTQKRHVSEVYYCMAMKHGQAKWNICPA